MRNLAPIIFLLILYLNHLLISLASSVAKDVPLPQPPVPEQPYPLYPVVSSDWALSAWREGRESIHIYFFKEKKKTWEKSERKWKKKNCFSWVPIQGFFSLSHSFILCYVYSDYTWLFTYPSNSPFWILKQLVNLKNLYRYAIHRSLKAQYLRKCQLI